MDTQALVMEAVQAVADRDLGSSSEFESSPTAVQYAIEDLWLRIAQVCRVAVELSTAALELTAFGLTAALAAELHRHAAEPATYRWAGEEGGGSLAEELRNNEQGVYLRLRRTGPGQGRHEDAHAWALDLANRLAATQRQHLLPR